MGARWQGPRITCSETQLALQSRRVVISSRRGPAVCGKTFMRARRVLLALLSILAAHGLAPAAHAQGWPQKPARIIVPFAPGGSSDGIARVIAQALSDIYGSQFIVENRPS